ncbi:hypothetical protein ACVW17_004763 [Bradyrhizobium sp. USDA 4473]
MRMFMGWPWDGMTVQPLASGLVRPGGLRNDRGSDHVRYLAVLASTPMGARGIALQQASNGWEALFALRVA